MRKELKVEMKAPDFNLDCKGKWVILYFYPKDDTPGCTREACAFKEAKPKFSKKNAVIVGVSKDSANSHEKFIKKFGLNFLLLADPDGKLCEAYGVFKEKSIFGKTFLGIIRSTFLINSEGKIAKIWRNVKVDGHEKEVLDAIP